MGNNTKEPMGENEMMTRQQKLDHIMSTPALKTRFEERLKSAMERVKIKDREAIGAACWNWNECERYFYGSFAFYVPSSTGGKAERIYVQAHQLSHFYATRQPQTDKLRNQILHKCNNKRCVNPLHLYIGTHRDNMKDLVAVNAKKTNRSYAQKLNEEQVSEIRKLYAQGTMKQADIAAMFGVSQRMISDIVRNVSWVAVGGPITKKRKELILKKTLRKLTLEQRKEVFFQFHFEKKSSHEIARTFGVTTKTIMGIINNSKRLLAEIEQTKKEKNL